jgi:hypothetical protein
MNQRYVRYAIGNASLEELKEVDEEKTEERRCQKEGDVVIKNKIAVMMVIKWRETMTLKKEKEMDIVTMTMIRIKEKDE